MMFDIVYFVLQATCDLQHGIGSYDVGGTYQYFGDYHISINNGSMQFARLNMPVFASMINIYVFDGCQDSSAF